MYDIYRYIDTSIKKEQIKVKTAALLTATVILTAGMVPQQAYAAETAVQNTQLANPWEYDLSPEDAMHKAFFDVIGADTTSKTFSDTVWNVCTTSSDYPGTGNMIEIVYSRDGQPGFTLRIQSRKWDGLVSQGRDDEDYNASNTPVHEPSTDISGVYESYAARYTLLCKWNEKYPPLMNVHLSGDKKGKWKKAYWSDGSFDYSLTAEDGIVLSTKFVKKMVQNVQAEGYELD